MPNDLPRSFGRPDPAEEPDMREPSPGAFLLPPVAMPPVHVPIVLVVDGDSLRAVSGQIQAMVAEAVRSGVAEALAADGT